MFNEKVTIMNKVMKKIIGHFNGVTKGLKYDTVMCRHHQRMIMLVRWTFLDYCERHRCGELSLEGFSGGELKRADIGMWMYEPYMYIHKTNGDAATLFMFSTEKLKALYYYIKSLK